MGEFRAVRTPGGAAEAYVAAMKVEGVIHKLCFS